MERNVFTPNPPAGKIELLRSGDEWCAQVGSSRGAVGDGKTPLIAAMRALVASRFGEEVPDA